MFAKCRIDYAGKPIVAPIYIPYNSIGKSCKTTELVTHSNFCDIINFLKGYQVYIICTRIARGPTNMILT